MLLTTETRATPVEPLKAEFLKSSSSCHDKTPTHPGFVLEDGHGRKRNGNGLLHLLINLISIGLVDQTQHQFENNCMY